MSNAEALSAALARISKPLVRIITLSCITDASFKQDVSTTTDVLEASYYLSRARNNLLNARIGLLLDYYRLRRLVDGVIIRNSNHNIFISS